MHVRADFLGCGCTNGKPFGKVGKACFRLKGDYFVRCAKRDAARRKNGYGKRSCRDTAYLCR
jgi:hypothetical protein